MARTKYSERFCSFCNKATRMELVGGKDSDQEKMWFRCTRCHHMSLLESKNEGKNGAKEKIDIDSATKYSPEHSFTVGEAIFHAEWNDFGKVTNKIRTSNGQQAIIVSFEKQGQRTLMENIKL